MTKIEPTQHSAILHRSTRLVPKKAVGGKGSYIFLEDGQKVLDSTGGAAVSCLGHGNEEVNQAVINQINQLSFCYSVFFGSQAAEDLAELLVKSTGGKLTKLLVVSSGSEAVEAAIKLARQYFLELPTPQPQRTKFISRLPSYHGITLGALGVGGHTIRRNPFAPLLATNTSHVSPCFPYRGQSEGEADEEYVARLAAELDAEFQRLGPESVCAFIAEPIAGASLGCVPAVPGYFPAMKAVCEKYGALFILDEVMCGIGRCGTLHAWEEEGVVPDIQTMGKGLGGGYAPVSGVLIGEKIVQALDKGSGAFRHGQTYQGHPIACAAALAVQKIIKRDNLLQNVRDMGAYLGKQLKARLESHPNVGDVRGKGLFWGIEFVQDKKTKEPFPQKASVGLNVQETALKPEYSISLLSGTGTIEGSYGDHVIIAPPYNISKEEVDVLVDATGRVIEDVFKRLGSGI